MKHWLSGVLVLLSAAAVYAQSADSLQAVQKVDTALLKTGKVLDEAEALTSPPVLNPSAATDTIDWVQKVYSTESNIVDSVNTIVSSPQRQVNGGIDKVESHTTDKYNNVAGEVNEGLKDVGINKSVDEVGLGSAGGESGINGLLPASDGLLNDVLPGGFDTEALQQAQGVLGKGEQVLGEGKILGGELQSIGQGDLTNTDHLTGLAEDQLMKTEALRALETETGAFDGLEAPLSPDFDARKMVEDQLKKEMVSLAMAHFATQAGPLRESVSKLGKYKSKYKEVQSFRNKQWVKRTSLADKSFRERVVPGLTFQVLDGDYLVIDFLPQVSYLINTKWQVGAGGIYRTNISKTKKPDQPRYNVEGVGILTSYQVWKTFWLYTEVNRNVVDRHAPPQSNLPAVDQRVDYDWLFGIKKAHQFTRHVKGHAQLLYNFLYQEQSSPYPSRVHLRFGFEWYFKPRKVKNNSKEEMPDSDKGDFE